MSLKHNLKTSLSIIEDWEARFYSVESTQIPKAEVVLNNVKKSLEKTLEELKQFKELTNEEYCTWKYPIFRTIEAGNQKTYVDIDEISGKTK